LPHLDLGVLGLALELGEVLQGHQLRARELEVVPCELRVALARRKAEEKEPAAIAKKAD
jgi:hypothetical protein